MFQLTYKIDEIDPLIHQISQFGAHFVSKGPEIETYYKSPRHQIRIEEGVTAELVLVKVLDHYQELLPLDVSNSPQLKKILQESLGERLHLTKQVIRYYLKNLLLEIHRYDKLPQLLHIRGESIEACKDLARQLNLLDINRIEKTSADLAEK